MSSYLYYVHHCKYGCPGHLLGTSCCADPVFAQAFLTKFCRFGCLGHAALGADCGTSSAPCFYSGKGGCSLDAALSCALCRERFCGNHRTHGHLEVTAPESCEKCSRPAMKGSRRCDYHGYRGVMTKNGSVIYDGR